VTAHYRPEPRILELGADFHDPVEPADFPKTLPRWLNRRWAEETGLFPGGVGALDEAQWIAHFARFEPLPDNISPPLALRYHGHQFRSYNPQIGDGRGFLYAQLRDGHDRLLDLATKGSGRTPYSRTADGRLTLQGGVREVLAANRLEALGVLTSKPFALFETGEQLHRGDEPSPARSSILTRLGWSHIRIGTFQRHAYEDSPERVRALMDHCIGAYYPRLAETQGRERVLGFLAAVVRANARLAAGWMAAGFVHGVLNSDNLNVTGESFDYGPWRFLPKYEPNFTAAYFDETGLYSYARQPEAVFWNLHQLAGALTLVLDDHDALGETLDGFAKLYERLVIEAFCTRLGVAPAQDFAKSADLLRALLHFLRQSQADWERTFYDLFCGAASEPRLAASPQANLYEGEAWDALWLLLAAHQPARAERLDHEYFTRGQPATMVYEDVTSLWARIAEDDDWSGFEAALAEIELMRQGLDVRPAAELSANPED
jgi:uncharacterized protein YdiU (UPF0061 family)